MNNQTDTVWIRFSMSHKQAKHVTDLLRDGLKFSVSATENYNSADIKCAARSIIRAFKKAQTKP